MHGEVTFLLLASHREFTGLVSKQNLFMLKFSTFCRPVFQKKVIVKGSTDAGEGTGKRTTPSEIHRTFVKSDWEMGGGGRLHSFIWRLRLKKSKTIQFFISFVRDVLSRPCYSGQNHSWGTTSWESDFSDTLIKNIAFEQVSQTVTQYSLCRNSVW